MKSARSQISSSRVTRIRDDMLQLQRELVGMDNRATSTVEDYASNLLLKFIARKEVTITDLLGISRQHGSLEDARESVRKLPQQLHGQQEPGHQQAETAEAGQLNRRWRRSTPSRTAQLTVLLLCHATVLGMGMFLFGLSGPMLLRQSSVTEPWFSLWLSGCCLITLLLLAFALPAIFPSLLGTCCSSFMRHLRLASYECK